MTAEAQNLSFELSEAKELISELRTNLAGIQQIALGQMKDEDSLAVIAGVSERCLYAIERGGFD